MVTARSDKLTRLEAHMDTAHILQALGQHPRAAVTGALWLMADSGGEQRPFVAGLVGDGVNSIRVTLANGAVLNVPVSNNGFHSGALADDIVAFSFTGLSGRNKQRFARRP